MNRLWRGVAIFVLGTGFGVALGFFIFPYVFPPPAASEHVAEVERSNLVATGMFVHANPSDPVHHGRGKVSVYERTVFLRTLKSGRDRLSTSTSCPDLRFAHRQISRMRCSSIWAACVPSRAASAIRSPPASTPRTTKASSSGASASAFSSHQRT